jgi:hypothetical protein
MKNDLIPLVAIYCRSKNLILGDYVKGLFSGLTPENMPKNFLALQERYHREWIEKGK